MASEYFNTPALARAKQHKEDLAQTSPQNPVLKAEDEKFLSQRIANDEPPSGMHDIAASKIADDGEEKEASMQDQMQVDHAPDQAVIPETQPASQEDDKSYDEIMREKAAERVKARKAKKNRPLDLPSQDEAEAATKGFTDTLADAPDNAQNEKRTWISYLNSLLPTTRPTTSSGEQDTDEASRPQKWKDYAASYVTSLPESWRKGKDEDKHSTSDADNENENASSTQTPTTQEREVSILLDKLSLSQFNNRVFSFSTETQKIYERFAQVLKDTINGAPTAYDDMDKLFREAGPKLEKQFKAMPPFVQTLVKSLPAKMGATLGPEFLAAMGEKPGADMKARMDAESGGSSTAEGSKKKKKKRRIPGLKALLSKEGAVATMLRNVVNFLQARFPFLASTTSVAMSLAVFILMFVFWYCHKRGKEVRLAKEAEAAAAGEVLGEVDDDDTVEEGDEDDDDEEPLENDEKYQAMLKDVEDKATMLERPHSS